MSIVTELKYTANLDKGVCMTPVMPSFIGGDQEAHRIIVNCYRDRKAVDLASAGVTAYFVRADGMTIPLNGETEGNKASVLLPAACYAVMGRFSLVIKLSLGNSINTVFWGEGAVSRSRTDVVIDPDSVIPSLEELLAQIDAMEKATAAANEAAASVEGFKAEINDQVSQLSKKNDTLTSAVNVIDSPITAEYITGNITNSGTVNTNNTARIRSAAPILITSGMRWTVDEQYRASVAIYNAPEFTGGNFVEFVGGSSSALYFGNISIPAKYIGKYMGIRIEKYGHEGENISGDIKTIGEYVKLHDPSRVLSIGNFRKHFVDDKLQFMPIRGASSFSWNWRTSILESGEEYSQFRGALTDLIPVPRNAAILNASPAIDHKDRQFDVYVAEYVDGVFAKRTQIISGTIHTIADNTNGIKLLAVYPSAITAEMTAANIMINFAVGFVGNIIPGDGQRPVYVAFGASTTVGAVHHFTGTSVTYTPYAFPDYIGQILGLETHNLGNGTTGFLARDGGEKPNFMDSIYNNPDVLERADLITLMFGYGNDATAGLPFGAWDDYFPYDAVGAFYTDGETEANAAGIATMLNAGATLTGCLNWCIKWIGDHYPKTTLVCIFGAPSGNHDYPVAVVANKDEGAGTAGVAPYKLSIDRGESSYNTAIDTLREKLNIPIINLNNDGLPFSYYSTMAKEADGSYSIFSTKGTTDAPVWNSHPNESGYLMYARYLAGRVSEYFKH